MALPRRPVDRPSTRTEILIGRTLAKCVHPVAAWRRSSHRAHVAVVGAYFAASYTLVFVALAVLYTLR